jgi:hypothetical protein
MQVLIIVGSIASYLGTGLLTARKWYGHIRPWTEPLNCVRKPGCTEGRHWQYHRDSGRGCFRRWGTVDSEGEALAFAAVAGLVWLPFLLVSGSYLYVKCAVTADHPLLPAEKSAKLARETEELERELERELR